MIVLSDIHANLSALTSVIQDIAKKYPNDRDIIVLGDIINYGMRPNECVETLRILKSCYNIEAIWGNHENAILTGDYSHFSEERGIAAAKATAEMLTQENKDFLNTLYAAGRFTQWIDNKHILYVHGSLENLLWKAITTEVSVENYKDYDYVISGHNHQSHFFKKHIKTDDANLRNKKFVTFINPGSVGQPRNQNACAHYAFINTTNGTVHLNTVDYDITREQGLYDGTIDEFYKIRLEKGI